MIYEMIDTHYKMPGWPNGIPGVVDAAGVIVCICPETHGVAFAMHIAAALNRFNKELVENTHDEQAT